MTASASDDLPPERRSIIAIIFDRLAAVCAVLVPYALIALGLRLIMARTFFVSGQGKIDGPAVAIGDFTIILPAQIKDQTFTLFQSQYAGLPLSPTLATYLFTYAEFVLPICLVFGFATRLSALALLIMVALIQLYVAPGLLWTLHVYLFAILAVLVSLGPGAISVDGLMRYVYLK